MARRQAENDSWPLYVGERFSDKQGNSHDGQCAQGIDGNAPIRHERGKHLIKEHAEVASEMLV